MCTPDSDYLLLTHDSFVTCEEIEAESPATAELREKVRQAARRLSSQGKVVITQKGKPVDPSFAKGVMEIRPVDE